MSYTVLFQGYKDESISHEDFVEHWLTTHAKINMGLPKLRSYEVMIVKESNDAYEPVPDGFAILRYDSEEDWDAAMDSPAALASMEGTAGIFKHNTVYFKVETHQFVGNPPVA